MRKDDFKTFAQATSPRGSNKSSSYVKALDWLQLMLNEHPFGFSRITDIWSENSIELIQELYAAANEQKHLGDASLWNIEGIPQSYLQNGYCTAALRAYQQFLLENNYEQQLLNIFDSFSGEEESLPKELEQDFSYPEFMLDCATKAEGKEVIREVKVRSNQNVFRKMILSIYQGSCCITGLDVAEVNRASHIIPWSEDKRQRLDPRNGLCLSATYDAAFDRHLISFDEDYRLLISKEIKDHYTSSAVKTYFRNQEGKRIELPKRFAPSLENLSQHRLKGDF